MNTLIKYCTVLGLAGCVAACSSILPDKEQDYQQSSEIPPLEVPPDLTTSTIEDPVVVAPNGSGSVDYSRFSDHEAAERQAKPATASKTEPLVSDEGAYVEIQAKYPQAWRLTGKALSRLDVEVIDQNRSQGLYYLLYEDQAASESGDGFWSSLAFWRDDKVESQEQEYRLKLLNQDGVTRLIVLNEADQPQSDGVGLKLLKRIEEKLNEI